MTARKVTAVVAVEVAADLAGRATECLKAVASEHRGSAADEVASFTTAADALLAVAALLKDIPEARCGVVMLDGQEVPAAVSAARAVAHDAEDGRIVVLAMQGGTRTHLGVLHGKLESLVIAKAMSQASANEMGDAPDAPRDDLSRKLSPAEYRVAEAVGRGATNKQVAGQLFISVKTVDYHLQNIYRKLGARSRTELAVLVAGAARGIAEPALSEDQLRFVQALADQPPVARWATGIPGIDPADETGD